MSENDLNREPIELVEIVLPRCINTYGTAPCTASGAVGSECYNCRNTCQDPNNYRDTPDRHLEPDSIFTQGDETLATDFVRNADLFAGFEVRFTAEPEGIIWEQGAGTGLYLGVTSGNLIFQISSSNVGKITVPAAQFAGKSMVIYIEIDFAASSTTTMRMWAFDPIELTNTFLGSDSFTAGTQWAGGDLGGIGVAGNVVASSGADVDWNGGIPIARFYNSRLAPADMSDNFNASLWLGRGVKGEPINEKYILPCLEDLGTIGTKINLAAADDDYEALGRRSSLDFSVKDFTHSDITQDPYLSTRLYDPATRSTFWRKWIVRQKFGKVGALVRVYDGYAGQPLSSYKVRAYVLDKIDRREDGLSFRCRDVLSRTEFRKAQIPVASEGVLSLDLTEAATTMFLAGDVTLDYPASGTVRINNEIMTYAATSYDAVDNQTDFTGLVRGTDGSTATEHGQEDLVQICRRYTKKTVAELLTEWLTTDAGIEAQLIDLEGINSETDTYLFTYFLTALITEPTGVDELLGRLSLECAFYIWWDERAQKIKTKAIRALTPADVVVTLTDANHIVADTLKIMEKPKQRINIINFYYNPRDFAGELDKAQNFKNGLQVVNGSTSLPEQYGNVVQTREIFGIFITSNAEVSQTASRIALRYEDVPTYIEFYVDAKDRNLWTGDIIQVDHPMLVDENGERVLERWLIIEAEEVDAGHLLRYVCANVTVDGDIYLVTINGLADYTPELFAANNLFITDNDGLNPDGTEGAKIS